MVIMSIESFLVYPFVTEGDYIQIFMIENDNIYHLREAVDEVTAKGLVVIGMVWAHSSGAHMATEHCTEWA